MMQTLLDPSINRPSMAKTAAPYDRVNARLNLQLINLRRLNNPRCVTSKTADTVRDKSSPVADFGLENVLRSNRCRNIAVP